MASSFPQPLTEQEEQIYVEKSQQGDAEARGKLIEHNLRLVAHIAKKYTSPGASQDDLISIGTIGLIKAVNTYTASRATRLATYAAKCIENEILMSIRASKRIKQEVSLSLPIGTDKDGNEISFNDILGTDTDEIVEDISLKIQVTKLYRAIAEQLSPREQRVIIQRYGSGRRGSAAPAGNRQTAWHQSFLRFSHRKASARKAAQRADGNLTAARRKRAMA